MMLGAVNWPETVAVVAKEAGTLTEKMKSLRVVSSARTVPEGIEVSEGIEGIGRREGNRDLIKETPAEARPVRYEANAGIMVRVRVTIAGIRKDTFRSKICGFSGRRNSECERTGLALFLVIF